MLNDTFDSFITSLDDTLKAAVERINYDYWYELDSPEPNLFTEFNTSLDTVFYSLIASYAGTSVFTLLIEAVKALKLAFRCSLSVSFTSYERHHIFVNEIADNVIWMFINGYYPAIYSEAVLLDHAASVIQRTWDLARFNPYHPIGKRRVERDFEEFEKDCDLLIKRV